MREQHPLDDLFARTLRDAEATPSDAVWKGIVQERGWAHLTLLQLQHRWGWLALLLMLGSTAGYLGLSSSNEEHMEMQGVGSATFETPASNASVGVTLTVSENALFGELDPMSTEPSNSSIASGPTVASSTTTSRPKDGAPAMERRSLATNDDLPQRPLDPSFIAPTTGTLIFISGTDQVLNVTAMQEGIALPTGPSTGTTSGTITEKLPKSLGALEKEHDRSDPRKAQGLATGRIDMLTTHISRLDRELFQVGPRNVPQPNVIGPRQAWWVAMTLGQYRETRTWKGGDAQLVKALQGTEMPHRTTNFGALAGLEGRKGWGITTGIEYGAARYDFQHLDQFRATQDSLVTHVITFNSVVLDSYVDTISTSAEVRRTVAAVNRYTTVRVPLEVSWHRAWRRWHAGLRGGLAMEFNTMRSGVTLMSSEGGTRSVDVSMTEKRTATLVSGGFALDVGYALTERLGLWASPGYAAGLFSLSPTDGSPYAVPERLGVRIRLAYTLRPGR